MNNDPIMDALTEQVACYRRLSKLAMIQHDHIQHQRTEELLTVLHQRQAVLDQLAALEKQIAPAKANWPHYLSAMPEPSQKQAESLLAETRQLLEKITSADRNDVMVLQQRKLNIGRQIRNATAARQVNRTYSTAAYGAARPRMDLKT